MLEEAARTSAVQLSQIAIIDREVSCLGSTSFPTGIGWAIMNHDGSVVSGAYRIKPAAQWLRYQNAWSPAAERLTGISMRMLDREGVSPREVLTRFVEAVGDRDLFSDEPDYDRHWLGMLADAAGVLPAVVKIGELKKLVEQTGLTLTFNEQPGHRAEPDARRLAMALLRR